MKILSIQLFLENKMEAFKQIEEEKQLFLQNFKIIMLFDNVVFSMYT